MPPPEWKRWRAEAAPRWEPTYGRWWEEDPPVVRGEYREQHREMRREEEQREGDDEPALSRLREETKRTKP